MKKYCLVIPDNLNIEEYKNAFQANAGINKDGYAELFIKLDKKIDIYDREIITQLPVPIICEYNTVKLSDNHTKPKYSSDVERYSEFECFTDIITRKKYWNSQTNMKIPETIISFRKVKEISAKEVLEILNSLAKEDIKRYKWQIEYLETSMKQADKKFLKRLDSAKTSEELSEKAIKDIILNMGQDTAQEKGRKK